MVVWEEEMQSWASASQRVTSPKLVSIFASDQFPLGEFWRGKEGRNEGRGNKEEMEGYVGRG